MFAFCSISTFRLLMVLVMQVLSGGQKFQSFLHVSWCQIERV